MSDENYLETPSYSWESLGETSTEYATSPTVSQRDYTGFAAAFPGAVIYTSDPYRWNAMNLRFVTDDAADAWDVDVFASKGEDYFTRIATLALTGGAQVGPATATSTPAVFVDTIGVTNENWITTFKQVDVAGGDRIASLRFDMCGFDTFAFVATSVATNKTLLIQGTGY